MPERWGKTQSVFFTVIDTQQKKTLTSKQSPTKYSWDWWTLESKDGQQRWKFTPPPTHGKDAIQEQLKKDFQFDPHQLAHSADLLLRKGKKLQPPDTPPPWSSFDFPNALSCESANATRNGIYALKALQEGDGHWAGDYGGPMFLLPGLVFASVYTDTPFADEKALLMRRYMLNHQNEDGGWGLHIEEKSGMFASVMQYCALRLLGEAPESDAMMAARKWILSNGGAGFTPSWGKFYLSLLGLYNWEGCNSLMPELWLLPKSLPIHPSRYWCHARMVYLPMSYCYGKRLCMQPTPAILDLRKEIYPQEYEQINWKSYRNAVAKPDDYHPASPLVKKLFRILNTYEKIPIPFLRKKAIDFTRAYIDAEDEQTNYIDIGPVNQVINSICVFDAYGKHSEQFQKHVDRWEDYLWLAEDGLKMNGYNGSQLWDTTFTAQAIHECKDNENTKEVLKNAYLFISKHQVRQEVSNRKKFFRHPSVGGWPFSTVDHGWPIADCTAEGVKAALKLHRQGIYHNGETIDHKRLEQAVDLILTWQNADGGWATYENDRAPAWIEKLNPSSLFGKIMVDYSWVECTSACITALVEFHRDYPEYQSTKVQQAIDRGIAFLLDQQQADGSWQGAWGVCFTYATWFGLEALTSIEQSLTISAAVQKAQQFLVTKQNQDGGWGESFHSCLEGEYIHSSHSQVVNTSWALLGLMSAGRNHKSVIEKGIKFLLDQQQSNGEWPQQHISGVFNRTCMISYSAYRNIFPLWAMGRYSTRYTVTTINPKPVHRESIT